MVLLGSMFFVEFGIDLLLGIIFVVELGMVLLLDSGFLGELIRFVWLLLNELVLLIIVFLLGFMELDFLELLWFIVINLCF